MTRAVEQSFSSLPRGARGGAAPPPNGQKKPRFSFVENTSSQTDLRVAFRALSERDPREPAVEMLMRVLDDGMSTRLYERICDRLGLCYDVSGMFEAYEDDGVLDVAAGAAARARDSGRQGDLRAPPRSCGRRADGRRAGEGARPAPLVRRGDARRPGRRGGVLRAGGARRDRADADGAPRRAREGDREPRCARRRSWCSRRSGSAWWRWGCSARRTRRSWSGRCGGSDRRGDGLRRGRCWRKSLLAESVRLR